MNAKRLRVRLTGLLQGIGFRPFVYRLAVLYLQGGWVANENTAVIIEIEGLCSQQDLFLEALQQQVPACGQIESLDIQELSLKDESEFYVKESLSLETKKSAFVCADIATCEDCLEELFDPENRRYLHPFISCCHCGGRYSLMKSLPYDRCNTSLEKFELCDACLAEYQDPTNRRFHAQTISCPNCPPSLSFCNNTGEVLVQKQAALNATVEQLKQGKIIALKGIGGFQLLVDATNQAAVKKLRRLKHRPSKPFAIMLATLAEAENLAKVTEQEKQLLKFSAAPIVLVKAKQMTNLATAVAPQQDLLGIMLAYAPVQHLICRAMQKPLVVTSGNLSNEPICIDNQQAFIKLSGIADFFLIHERDILRPLDDSIVRVIANVATVLRRARGYVPTPIRLKKSLLTTLAVGGQLKNSMAIADDKQVILSQYLGDLESLASQQQFQMTLEDLEKFYAIEPQQIVCDRHPDYVSSIYAARLTQKSNNLTRVQHHHAHILACMAEWELEPPVLGVAWDGSGLGEDNQLWGGEFLQIQSDGFQRVAYLRPFPLVGGTVAMKEPRRIAFALLSACFDEKIWRENYPSFVRQFSSQEIILFSSLLKKQLNCSLSSSMGRLFDGFASLLGLCQINEFEGQAAMALEQAASKAKYFKVYALGLIETSEGLMIDWQALLTAVLDDLEKLSVNEIAASIHHALAAVIIKIAEKMGEKRVVLSGGCFQNSYLVEAVEQANHKQTVQIFRHKNIPPNDGGIALGQIYARALAAL